jgi:hypothetical protein
MEIGTPQNLLYIAVMTRDEFKRLAEENKRITLRIQQAKTPREIGSAAAKATAFMKAHPEFIKIIRCDS